MSDLPPMAQSEQLAEIANLIADSAAPQKPVVKPAVEAPDDDKPDDDTPEGKETDDQAPAALDVDDSTDTDAADDPDGDIDPDDDLYVSPDDDAGDVDTLNNLAEELETPIGDMYALGIKMAEGENQTIGSLKDFYEQNHDIVEIRQQVADKEVALEAQSADIASIPQISDELIQARATVIAITQNYERVDWNSVRETNPGEYAALQQDFQTAFTQAQAAEKAVAGKVDKITSSTDDMQQAKLYQKLPKLKDDEYRNKVAGNVLTFATKYGFSAKEVEDISDSRLMHLLIEASSGALVVDSAAEKRVAKEMPKGIKPTRSKPNHESASRKAKLKRLTDKARASSNMHDKTDAISALIAEG